MVVAMYEDKIGFRNASGCVDPVPYAANNEMRREEWRRLCACVKEMIAVANRYGMRIDGLIKLTGRRTGIRNYEQGNCEDMGERNKADASVS